MVNKRLPRVGHNQIPAVDHRTLLHFPQGQDHVVVVVAAAAAAVVLGNSWLIVTAAMLHALQTWPSLGILHAFIKVS